MKFRHNAKHRSIKIQLYTIASYNFSHTNKIIQETLTQSDFLACQRNKPKSMHTNDKFWHKLSNHAAHTMDITPLSHTEIRVTLPQQLAEMCCSKQQQTEATAVAAAADLTGPSPWDSGFLHCLHCSCQVEWAEALPRLHCWPLSATIITIYYNVILNVIIATPNQSIRLQFTSLWSYNLRPYTNMFIIIRDDNRLKKFLSINHGPLID